MQSSFVLLPPDMGHDFLRTLPRVPRLHRWGPRPGQHTAAPVHSVLQSLGKAAVNCLARYHHHHHRPNPRGAHPPPRLSRRRSPWSAWKCMTCCGGRCPGERPGHRPPGSQCKPPTRWSFSQHLSGLAPPLPLRRGGRPAAAAAPLGSSPLPGTSAGHQAGGGSQCLPAVAPSPWRGARAACSTRCWGVWWRRGCAPRCGGSQWQRSPRGHRAAATQSTPAAAWWSRGTRGNAGPSGWSSSAAGTPSSKCACSPGAWAAGGDCSSWSKSGTPAESPGTGSPWRTAQGGTAALVRSLTPTPHSQGAAPAFPPLLLRAASAFPPLLLLRAAPGGGYGERRKTSGLNPSVPETNRKMWRNRLLTGTSANKSPARGGMKTSADLVIWQDKQICDP